MRNTPRFGNGTQGGDALKGENSVLQRARKAGIAGDVEALQMALAAMLGGYDRLVATTPEVSRGIVEGAFGKTVVVARAILEAV